MKTPVHPRKVLGYFAFSKYVVLFLRSINSELSNNVLVSPSPAPSPTVTIILVNSKKNYDDFKPDQKFIIISYDKLGYRNC